MSEPEENDVLELKAPLNEGLEMTQRQVLFVRVIVSSDARGGVASEREWMFTY
jgi:hypothetical protein